MQTMRQIGVGVIVAIVSIVLVVGGIFLSLAESLPPAATPTQIPPTFPESFPTPTPATVFTLTSFVNVLTPSKTLTPLVSPTPCTPPSGWIRVTAAAGDTVYSLAERYKTTAESLNAANC